jgi:parallel beta-helix repeat protein
VSSTGNSIQATDIHVDDHPDNLNLMSVLGNNAFVPDALVSGNQILPDSALLRVAAINENPPGGDPVDPQEKVVQIGESTTGLTITASTLGGQGAALNAIVTDDAGDATVTGNMFDGNADTGVTIAGNGSTVEANNFSDVGDVVDAYILKFNQAADLSAIGGANGFGPAASFTPVDFQTGGVRVNGSSLVPGPEPTRSLNTIRVEPGGTIKMTVTAILDSVADISLADRLNPDFSSTELVDTSFSTSLESVTGGDVILGGDRVAAGGLTIVYRQSVSDNTTVRTTCEWTEFPDSAIRVDNADFSVIGDGTVEVVGNGSATHRNTGIDSLIIDSNRTRKIHG